MSIGSASRRGAFWSWGALALLLLGGTPLLGGCGFAIVGMPGEDAGDGAGRADAGGDPLRDAGDADAGEEPIDAGDDGDASVEPDAGPDEADAGPADAGDEEDGGEGLVDAGEPVDASVPGDEDAGGDAGDNGGDDEDDAGYGGDAGYDDDDAGSGVDAGDDSEEDAGAPGADAGESDAGGVIEPGLDAGPDDDGPLGVMELCFPEIFGPTLPGPDYDQFAPLVGSHCRGTDHQDIHDVERVVFLGDSITVGSPPTLSRDFYRSLLAEDLAAYFGLRAPSPLWRPANLLTGEAALRESGDFASCARWGARTDDLLGQLNDCFPTADRAARTLIILTVGGNDLANLAKDGRTRSFADNLAAAQGYVGLLRGTIEWLKAPGRFPNGVDVVFANVYEFTDGTGDLESCPATGLGTWLSFANFENWEDPEPLKELMLWVNEEYMRIATDTGSDMMFLFESFCGHGFRRDDPSGPCYRGPGAPRWLDATCIHPTPAGHARIAEMFLDVIVE